MSLPNNLKSLKAVDHKIRRELFSEIKYGPVNVTDWEKAYNDLFQHAHQLEESLLEALKNEKENPTT